LFEPNTFTVKFNCFLFFICLHVVFSCHAQNAENCLHEGNIKASLGDDAGAIAAYSSCIENGQGTDEMYRARGRIYYRSRAYKNALADFSYYLGKNKYSADTTIILRHIYSKLKLNDYSGAEAEIKRYLNAGYVSDSLNYIEAARLYFLKQYQESVSYFDKAIQMAGNKANYYADRAFAKMGMEDTTAALADAEMAVHINPRDSYSQFVLSFIHNYCGDYEAAFDHIDEAIYLDPFDADYLNMRGNIFDKSGKKEEAIIQYNKAIELDSMSAVFYSNRADVYVDLDDTAKALQDVLKGLSLDSTIDPLYNTYGRILQSQARYKEAIPMYQQAITLDTNEAVYYNNLANIYSNLEDYKTAIPIFLKAIALDSTNGDYYYDLADAFEELEDYDEAISNSLLAIKYDNTDEYHYSQLGRLYQQIGEYSKGLVVVNEGLQRLPESSRLCFRQGHLYEEVVWNSK
jgi:tetratricopeptide (TPR) repeat protein